MYVNLEGVGAGKGDTMIKHLLSIQTGIGVRMNSILCQISRRGNTCPACVGAMSKYNRNTNAEPL